MNKTDFLGKYYEAEYKDESSLRNKLVSQFVKAEKEYNYDKEIESRYIKKKRIINAVKGLQESIIRWKLRVSKDMNSVDAQLLFIEIESKIVEKFSRFGIGGGSTVVLAFVVALIIGVSASTLISIIQKKKLK